MATDDQGNDGPSLELPSLGISRWTRRRKAAEPAADTSAPVADVAPERTPEPTPVPEPTPEPARTPPPRPVPEPTPPPEPTRAVAPAPAPRPARSPAQSPAPTATPAGPASGPQAPDGEQPEPRRRVRGPRSRPSLPALPAMAAAVLTGAVVGLVTVALTWGSLRGCEVTRGTATCGGGPGLLLLLVIGLVGVLLGATLLRAFRVNDPGSTSLLGVALLTVVALLFLIGVLGSGWMIVVIPVVAAATFALAHWVTTAFVEPARR